MKIDGEIVLLDPQTGGDLEDAAQSHWFLMVTV